MSRMPSAPPTRFRVLCLAAGMALMGLGPVAAQDMQNNTTSAAPVAPAAQQPPATAGTAPPPVTSPSPSTSSLPADTPVQPAPAASESGPSGAALSPVASDASGNMAQDAVPAAVDVENAALPHDLSPWGMFMAADWVVKGVMIGLAFASLVTWTIALAKLLELAGARTRARRSVDRLAQASTLRDAMGASDRRWRGPVGALTEAAEEERARSEGLSADGTKERAAVALQRIEARAGRRIARGTGVLATIGSTAPFVGLFGTVWGIMNSFIGISETNTTNLAVVAPGIAEALLATAIGLVAAIPAVVIYNLLARQIAGYRTILADATATALRHLSRELDRRDSGVVRDPAPRGRLQAAE